MNAFAFTCTRQTLNAGRPSRLRRDDDAVTDSVTDFDFETCANEEAAKKQVTVNSTRARSILFQSPQNKVWRLGIKHAK